MYYIFVLFSDIVITLSVSISMCFMKKWYQKGLKWVEFPYYPYFLTRYQIVGLLDLFLGFNDFLVVINLKINQKMTKDNMIIMYSTLIINIIRGKKNPPIRWYFNALPQ